MKTKRIALGLIFTGSLMVLIPRMASAYSDMDEVMVHDHHHEAFHIHHDCYHEHYGHAPVFTTGWQGPGLSVSFSVPVVRRNFVRVTRGPVRLRTISRVSTYSSQPRLRTVRRTNFTTFRR